MALKSTIRAFQKVLKGFKFDEPNSFSEDFAQKRFLKKFQEPSDEHRDSLVQLCWEEFISNDHRLPEIDRPLPHGYRRKKQISSEWYKVRDSLQRGLGRVSFDSLDFPKGSEFVPTRGANSVEARLSSSVWTCTYENFEAFSKLCYNHSALKRSTKKRYSRWFKSRGFDSTEGEADRLIYNRFKALGFKNVGFHIFVWKLRQVVTLTRGSRFSTVPKNNEAVRPINVEPFGNILIQRQVGNWIRSEIENLYGYDLDTLADTHRLRIRDVDKISTIDLKNASDSISYDLCRFLLPERLMKHLEFSRSSMILGLDGNYHLLQKISPMGNGFIFELMSLILVAVCRVLDPEASVFGDDIIIKTERADRLIELLSEVGLQVNKEKSFTSGPFRESCGGNYHREEGYIESYDFMWPTSIGDCVVIWNKVVRLEKLYPSFKKLYHSLYRVIPKSLHGGPSFQFENCGILDLVGLNGHRLEEPHVNFPLFFVTKRRNGKSPPPKLVETLKMIHQDPRNFRLVAGFEFKSKLRTPSRRHLSPSRHWAKYEMYLDSGRVAKDTLRDSGEWCQIWFVNSDSQSYRAANLVT